MGVRAVMVCVPPMPMAFVTYELVASVDVATVYGSTTTAGECNQYDKSNKGSELAFHLK
jgi:hypothetical protein